MFVKIFLSFWLTVALFAAAEEVAARFAHNEEQRMIAGVRSIVDEARPIVAAYERQGARGATDAAGAFERRRGVFADLLDANRHSLVGRPVRPAEIDMARMADRLAAAGLPNSPFSAAEGVAAQQVVTSAGERLTLVVGLPRSATTVVSRALLASSPVRLVFILTIGGIVCFAVARHLTWPIVSVSHAATALADGHLQTRVGPTVRKRRDEIGALGRDFDAMAARLEALVAGQRRLLGDVSHELRSPLARLTVALSLARQRSPAEAAEYFSRIERETMRLDRLIEQLLTLARIETDVDAEHRQPFNLAHIVQEVVSDADFEARGGGTHVALADDAAPVAAMTGLPELMRSAIENVVRNGIRYTAAGTTVQVGLHLSSDGRGLVTVRDHGRGVEPSLVSDIFKPFRRAGTTSGGSTDGAGLGLAITDRVVRMHGGRVWAANGADGGLIVTMDIPLTGA